MFRSRRRRVGGILNEPQTWSSICSWRCAGIAFLGFLGLYLILTVSISLMGASEPEIARSSASAGVEMDELRFLGAARRSRREREARFSPRPTLRPVEGVKPSLDLGSEPSTPTRLRPNADTVVERSAGASPTAKPTPSANPTPSATPTPTSSAAPAPSATGTPTPTPEPSLEAPEESKSAVEESNMEPLPERGSVQADPSILRAEEATLGKVRSMFLHAWDAYKLHAWGMDVLKPVSGQSENSFLGMAATLVDGLTTAKVMGLDDQFEEAADWVEGHLEFDRQRGKNVFESTIRVVGGLLSAYELSGRTRPGLARKARELADHLSVAFDTPSGAPMSTVDLAAGTARNPDAQGTCVAEVATLQVELETLTRVTGDPSYAIMGRKAMRTVLNNAPETGLFPMYLSTDSGQFRGGTVTLGARGDSAYEYLLKQWILAGGLAGEAHLGNPAFQSEPAPLATDTSKPAYRPQESIEEISPDEKEWFLALRRQYDRSVTSIHDILVDRTTSGLTYIAEKSAPTAHGKKIAKMDHLVCFAAGMLALGARGSTRDRDLTLAKEIAHTCHEMYARTSTHLAPEIVRFSPDDMIVDAGAKHSLLRPEAVEAWFILFRITGDPIYREWGRQFIDALETHAKVPSGGYASINDAWTDHPTKRDSMESFFLAETLKYLYLLFADGNTISLDQWVFNTEAHPMPIFHHS